MNKKYDIAIREIDRMLGKMNTEITNKDYKHEIKKIDETLRNLELKK